MDLNFHVYHALHDDTDKGWVWFLNPAFTARMTLKIRNPSNGKSVYCEYRDIDEPFLTLYNERAHTRPIDPEGTYHAGEYFQIRDSTKFEDILVISGWYRSALGIPGANTCSLDVRKPRSASWADLRAACQHPEPGVRVATRVAILGTWLAVVGLLAALVEVLRDPLQRYVSHFALAILAVELALVFAILCYCAGRGIKPRG